MLFDLGEADWWGSVFLATNVLNGSRAYFTALEVRGRSENLWELEAAVACSGIMQLLPSNTRA